MKIWIVFMLAFLFVPHQKSPNLPHSLTGQRHAFSPLDQWDNGYPEERFNKVLEVFDRVFSPIIEARGGKLRMLIDWSDGAVNMWAWRHGPEYWLEIPGGMARYHLIIEEGFIQSICHELGHLLGGAPAHNEISYEGQSDYFSSLKCMKRILPEIEPFKELHFSDEVISACALVDHMDKFICQRSLMGALSLTSYYAELERAKAPSLLSPSREKVSQSLRSHPPAQCRLDTMLAGTLCDVSIDEELSFENFRRGACVDGPGARPSCWFYD